MTHQISDSCLDPEPIVILLVLNNSFDVPTGSLTGIAVEINIHFYSMLYLKSQMCLGCRKPEDPKECPCKIQCKIFLHCQHLSVY